VHKIRNFHEGHSTVGEWQVSSRVVAGSREGKRHGDSMVCVNRPLVFWVTQCQVIRVLPYKAT
jgi:hypothetical protein